MNKYFTVTLMYDVDHSEVLNNVEKIETTDTERIIIIHWLYVGRNWCRTMELINPNTVNIMTYFNLHDLKR